MGFSLYLHELGLWIKKIMVLPICPKVVLRADQFPDIYGVMQHFPFSLHLQFSPLSSKKSIKKKKIRKEEAVIFLVLFGSLVIRSALVVAQASVCLIWLHTGRGTCIFVIHYTSHSRNIKIFI